MSPMPANCQLREPYTDQRRSHTRAYPGINLLCPTITKSDQNSNNDLSCNASSIILILVVNLVLDEHSD